MTARPLLKLEALALLDRYRHHWTGHEWPRTQLADVLAGRGDDTACAVLDRWLQISDGAPPTVDWLAAQLDRIDRHDDITLWRQAARQAIRRTA